MIRMFTYFLMFLFFSGSVYSQEDIRGLKKKLESQAGKRWAICIGVNNYTDKTLSSLKKACNDALGLGFILETQGEFEVFTFTDVDMNGEQRKFGDSTIPTKHIIISFLDELLRHRDISPNDLVVFSFSGHGISKDGQGYLLPIDWRSDLTYESAIPLSYIENWLKELGVTKSLIFLDACREEMTATKSIDYFERLHEQKFEEAYVSAVYYATKKGMFSYEDPNSNFGAFTRYVLEGLNGGGDINRDGLVTFRELQVFIEDELSEWARENRYNQRPFIRLLDEQSGDLALTLSYYVTVNGKIDQDDNYEEDEDEKKQIQIGEGDVDVEIHVKRSVFDKNEYEFQLDNKLVGTAKRNDETIIKFRTTTGTHTLRVNNRQKTTRLNFENPGNYKIEFSVSVLTGKHKVKVSKQ